LGAPPLRGGRAIRSNFCSAKIPLLSLARMKIRIRADFYLRSFCFAKTSKDLLLPASLLAALKNGIPAVFRL
jgi:hypothetical protein